MTYRSAPSPAVVLGGLLALLAWGLGSLLVARAVGWPVSFPAFLAYLCGAVLLALGFAFAFWAYAPIALHYVLAGDTLTIRLGPLQQVIALGDVERIVPGYSLPSPRVRGVSWWGFHVGRARQDFVGDTLFYSTHRQGGQLLYLVTPLAAFAISPSQPARFTRALQARPAAGSKVYVGQPAQGRPAVALPWWRNRRAQLLGLAALLLNLALFGFVFTVMPTLPQTIPLAFPPGVSERFGPKDDVMELPLVALAALAINTGLALALHAREQGAAYLLLALAAGIQVLMWAATAAAVA